MPTEQQANHEPVILKLAIESGSVHLFPDEDFIRKCLISPTNQELAEVARDEFHDLSTTGNIDPTENRWKDLGITWEASLLTTGTVSAYAIRPEFIVGYHVCTDETFKSFATDHGPLHPGLVKELFYAEPFKRALMELPYRQRLQQPDPPDPGLPATVEQIPDANRADHAQTGSRKRHGSGVASGSMLSAI
jgi:hypothetical protein